MPESRGASQMASALPPESSALEQPPDVPASASNNSNTATCTPPPRSPGSSSPAGPGSPSVGVAARDSSWLQVEACRDFRRDTCPRGDKCRFAHPDAKIIGRDGKVTCCYDFLKGRCHRDYCKYYHPPPHIKDRLVSAGRQFGAMMSGMSRYPLLQATPPFVPRPAWDGYSPTAMGPVWSPFMPQGYPERLPICPDFMQGQCHAPASVCPFVHPGPYIQQNMDQTVTVCHNFMHGQCTRGDKCRYYHFPLQHFVQHQQPAFTPGQGFPVGQPAMVPILYPSPLTPVPFISVEVQQPFSTVPPTSVASSPMVPPVPVMPMLSPVDSTPTPVLAASPSFITAQPVNTIPAQPVLVATAPMSVITSTTSAMNGESNATTTISEAAVQPST